MMIDLTVRDFGQCPECGAYGEFDEEDNIDYDTIASECHCPVCGAEWREFEKRVPDGFEYQKKEYDKDGYEIPSEGED